MQGASWKQALEKLEQRLVEEPDSIDIRFERASLLQRMGQLQEAKSAYLELLQRFPSHRGALNNLGTLLYETGYRSAARTAYSEAVARHPRDPMGHVNLANLLQSAGDLSAAKLHYETALHLDPDYPPAHQGLAYILFELGQKREAEFHRQKGFKDQPIIELPYYGDGIPISVLLLVSAVGGNTPMRNFLDNRIFRTYVVVVEFCHEGVELPPHQLVFNAISDADLVVSALSYAESVIARSKAPVLNSPAAVRLTDRMKISRLFKGMPGVVTPKMTVMPRESYTSPNILAILEKQGFEFPLLLRTPGYHTGRHFLRVNRPDELADTVRRLPGSDLMAIQHLDARGSDGKFRKYRVMMINGGLYPLHLAISSQWKVHYYTADMSQPDHIAEEARFLENMSGVLGPRAMASLAQIQDTLRLNYAGIDFGLNDAGEILLFEANATMIVNPLGADVANRARRSAVDQIYGAVRRMLEQASGKRKVIG